MKYLIDKDLKEEFESIEEIIIQLENINRKSPKLSEGCKKMKEGISIYKTLEKEVDDTCEVSWIEFSDRTIFKSAEIDIILRTFKEGLELLFEGQIQHSEKIKEMVIELMDFQRMLCMAKNSFFENISKYVDEELKTYIRVKKYFQTNAMILKQKRGE